jgi:squalene-hopene/tetraprenyl-beta-curcumene cyclase
MKGMLALVVLLATAQEAQYPAPGKNSPDEPVAAKASPAKAAAFLDAAAINWTRRKQCVTCHTNLPYAWARPSLKAHESPALGEVRAFLEKIAENWEAGKPTRKLVVPYAWDSQIVGTAVALAVHDARTTGKLHPLTKKAFEKTWAIQRPDGAWSWPDCDWPPLERDEYFGAAYVAIGVGLAPDDYARSEAAKPGLDRLRAYLKSHPAPDLHHRIMLLWASLKLDGLMTPAEREATLRDVLALQRDDGGWCLPSFGDWKRHDGTPNRKDAPSDGYATGLAVYLLRISGFEVGHPAVKRGAEWLKSNQRESGRWFTRSLGTDDNHYLSHVGTAYAVMALDACGELGK